MTKKEEKSINETIRKTIITTIIITGLIMFTIMSITQEETVMKKRLWMCEEQCFHKEHAIPKGITFNNKCICEKIQPKEIKIIG